MFEDPKQAARSEPAWVCGERTQHCMHVGLGQSAEVPTQTTERVEKAFAKLQLIERFACGQHDHVSFAKAWMLVLRSCTRLGL